MAPSAFFENDETDVVAITRVVWAGIAKSDKEQHGAASRLLFFLLVASTRGRLGGRGRGSSAGGRGSSRSPARGGGSAGRRRSGCASNWRGSTGSRSTGRSGGSRLLLFGVTGRRH